MASNGDDSAAHICHNCVGDTFLKELIERDGTVAECSYCDDDEERCITIDELADQVEGAFDRHYVRTSTDPDMYEDMMLRDKELAYDWYRHGEPVHEVIQQEASVEPEVANDVIEILDNRHSDFESAQLGLECEFDPESHYEEKGVGDLEVAAEWQVLEHSLKSRSRFFNADAEAFLSKLFEGLEGQMTQSGSPVVVVAGPEQEVKAFYRARVFNREDEVDGALARPDLDLGPPPGAKAKAGRMNAHGISVFYGAFDKDVALAEVRPPVGSLAVVGQFALVRDVRLLDVTALQSLLVEGSVFDPAYADRLSLAKFMSRLSDRITTPVMPDDEPTEYLVTQMIADFLARRPGPSLDGILFKSVQRSADEAATPPEGDEATPVDFRNVVLFHHASRVEELEIPKGTELRVSRYWATEDGNEPDYAVYEELPPKTEAVDEPQPADGLGLGDFENFRPHELAFDPSADVREPHLRVEKDGLIVRHVRGVSFSTEDFEVRRHRMEHRDFKF